MNWTKVRLGEILEKSESWVSILPDQEYKEVTVKLWGRGVSLRCIRLGSEIGSSRRLKVSYNQFIVSRIDARHGAFGLIPEKLDGAVVSNDFPVFNPDLDRLNPAFLSWFSKTQFFVEACKQASEGTTNRIRLKDEWFSNIEITIPSIEEQRRIVSRIESLTASLSEASELRQSIQNDAQAMLASAFQRIVEGATYRPLAEVAPIVRRPVDIDPEGEYHELGVRSFGKGTFHKPVLNGIDVGTKKLYRIEAGDLVFSNVFAWEGAIAVVQPEDTGRVGSHRFITCLAKEQVAIPDFLCFYLLTPEGLEKIQKASPGGAGRNRTLGLEKLEKIEVPVPDYKKQRWFNRLQQQVAAIQQAQADNQPQLDALQPAILDRAFKGLL